MRIDEYLINLRKNNNIIITCNNDELKIKATREDLTNEIVAEIKSKKSEIIEFFRTISFTNTPIEIPQVDEKENYKLSIAQRSMYFLHELDKTSIAYNQPQIFKLEGDLDKKRLSSALTKVIARHESLRTFFEIVENEPVQKILEPANFDISHYYSASGDVNKIINEFIKPFDINKYPLVRVGLIEISSKEHILMVDMHHIIADGISQGLLINDFMSFYKGDELPELVFQYKNYAEWQYTQEQQQKIADQKIFWLKEFEEEPITPELPLDFARPLIKKYEGDSVKFDLSIEETNKLKSIAKKEECTMFMLILSIYNILISKLSGQEDIVIGTPIAGRQHADLENIIGMFVNTLSLRNHPKGELSFKDFLKSLKDKTIACINNQSFPYEALIKELKIERNASHNPLFDILFVFNNLDTPELEISGLLLKKLNQENTSSKFDITLSAIENSEQIALKFEYSSELFRKETVEKFVNYFKKIVSSIVTDINIKLKDIDLISDNEKHQLLYDFNDTKKDFPTENTIVDLFEEQVEKSPGNVAVIYEGNKITYGELSAQSNKLASLLIERKSDSIIAAIYAEPSIEMIIGILGILKSGMAFLPLDPEQNSKRQEIILKESNCKLLVTQQNIANDLSFDGEKIINNWDLKCDESYKVNTSIKNSDLLYVVYTSGSTGKPKGVKIRHSNMVNYVEWLKDTLQLSSKDKSVLTSSFAFDLGYSSIFPLLCSGGIFHIIPRSLYLWSEKLLDYIDQNKISYLKLTPSLFSTIVRASNFADKKLESLRYIILGGESIIVDDVELAVKLKPHITFINHYGPSETTVGVIYQKIQNIKEYKLKPTIGRPINNTKAFILDSYQKLIPSGIVGELYIGGKSVGAGYLGQKDLTNEKFIQDPINQNELVYRTGDLAKWLPDGRIEFIGRTDDQVKIRGFRIELGDIESQLSNHNQIKEAVALVKEQEGDKFIIAYYVAEKELEISELRTYLLEKLPDYMIPAYYIHLDKIPLTPNGKINKKVLLDQKINTQSYYVAPRTTEEKLLVDIWSKVLGINNISITDNFFSIGGDSIKSIQISSRLRGVGYKTSVKDIITSQTIKELSLKLTKTEIISDQSVVIGQASLTPVQKWFFECSIKEKNHYNQSVMLSYEEVINVELVRDIFKKIQEHHDALRIVIKKEGNEIVQQNMDTNLPLSLEEYNLKVEKDQNVTLLEKCNTIQSGIDLDNGPLMKLGLFHMESGSRLLIVIHHLAVDGISWRILFEDIETLYNQIRNNQPLSLPLKTDSFLSWSTNLLEYTMSKRFQFAKQYWDIILNKKFDRIIRDNPNVENLIKNNNIESFRLSKDKTTNILARVHSTFNTQINDLLLTALLLSINKKYGNNSLKISLESHGREEIQDGLNVSRTIGWFTGIYPVILEKQGQELSEIIKQVKEILREIPNNGIDYLLQEYLVPDISAGKEGAIDKAQLCFNYLGQFDADIEGNSYTIAKESVGNMISTNENNQYDWTITGIVIDGQLEMRLTYCKNLYNKETISTLMDFYEESLIEVIDYCNKYGKIELSPSDLTYKGLSISQLDMLQSKYEINDIYLLSPMQEGMLFHTLLDSDAGHYFEQMKWEMRGDLNLLAVEKSINDLMHRYDILRTIFLHEGFERPIQIVLKDRKIDFVYKDIQDEILKSSKEEVIRSYQMNDRSKKFELSKDVLMRLTVLKIADADFEFIWSHHHILMDGWCMGIIVNEFREIYSQNRKGQEVALSPVNPYSNYIKWLDDIDKEVSNKYWQNYLESYESLTTLPKKEILLRENSTYNIVSKQLIIDREQTQLINKVSRECSVTTNTIIQGAWGILLSKYNNVNDVVFGSVVSGRPAEIEGIETMVGLFINTIPVRLSYSGEDTLGDLLKLVQSRAFESEQHQYSPLSEIQSLSELGRGLLDHILVFENYPISNEIERNDASNYDDFTVANVNIHEQTNYDLTIIIVPEEEISIKIDYNAEVYNQETIENVSEQLKKIIDQITTNSEILVSSIEIISEKEKRQILYEFNNTKEEYSTNTLMTELFEEQVKLSPNNVAIIADNKSYSYEWLNTVTNQLANLLREKGVQRESSVVVIMDRDIELIVTLLGILKSGGKYVPIEPYIPINRKRSILKSVNVEYIITNKKYQSDINYLEDGILSINNIFCIGSNETQSIELNEIINKGYTEINISSYSNLDLKRINTSEDLAYVIFTSGSSGEPKGVAVQHKPVINLIEWVNKTYNISAQDKVLLVSSVSFDLSVYDIFGFLAVGGAIRIANKEDLEEPDELAKIIIEEGITFWDSAPAMLQQVIPFLENRKQEAAEKGVLRLCFLSGDWIPLTMPPIMKSLFKDLQFIALGGATEATVWSNFYEVGDIDEKWKSIPYGKPMQNAKYFVLDKERNLCPIGFAGDLYIGGQCLAKEYINDKELSDRKFIPSPFDTGGMLYDTGDMAKWFPDGNIEFLGRKDSQIKIRGYRIELGEIESRLLKLKGIEQVLAQVISKSKYDKFICMYYVSENLMDEDVLKDFLSVDLPDFMLPKYIIHLKDMPVSKNGKVDRKQLPSPDSLIDKSKIEKPKSETEKKLIQIWSNLLHVNEDLIGITEDFFQLGGHSILAVHLISAVQRKFFMNLKLRKIFENPTIEKLAELVDSMVQSKEKSINLIEKREYYPASPAQERLFFEQVLNKDTIAFNINGAYEIKGEVNIEKLSQSFQILINRHNILRTSLRLLSDRIVQFVNNDVKFELTKIHHQKYETLKEAIIGFTKPFDLNGESLIRCGYFKHKVEGDFLLVDIHHVVCDGISLSVLMHDFMNIYNGKELIPLELNYVDYVNWQSKNNIENQKQYWLKNLSGELPILDLPTMQDRESVDIHPASIKILEINKELYKRIKKFTSESGTSDFMFLLSIFYILLSKMTGQSDIIIGTDAIGRYKSEFKNIVGTFTNLLPLRLRVQPESIFKEFLSEVKECVLQSYENQDFQIDQMISLLKQENKLSGNLFDVHFSFMNYLDSEAEYKDAFFVPSDIKGDPTTQYEFKLEVKEGDGKFTLNFIYSKELYDSEIIEIFKKYYYNILNAVLQNTTIDIENIELENTLMSV